MWRLALLGFVVRCLPQDFFEEYVRVNETWTLIPRHDNIVRWSTFRSVRRSIDINVNFKQETNPSATLSDQSLVSCISFTEPSSLIVSDAPPNYDQMCRTAIETGQNLIGDTTCEGELRVPQAETWDYWRDLDKQEIAKFKNNWQTIDYVWLRGGLLDSSNGPYFSDGMRRAYLEFKLSPSQTSAIQKWNGTELRMCYAEQVASNLFTKVQYVGSLIHRPLPEITSPATITETSMRVFFEPGWRLKKSVRGSDLQLEDKLALKMSGCEGKMDYLALRIDQAAAIRPLQTGRTGPSSKVQLLEFDLGMTPTTELDTTSDWKRAAFFARRSIRRAAVRNKTAQVPRQPNPRKIRDRRNVADDSLKMSLCLYTDPSDSSGIPVGTTHFTLASSDAAEFVTLSIFILLGLPVFCMWTVGCLSYRHKRLRVDLRRMRLVQQRDQVEARLARYLGFRGPKPGNESSDDEDIDATTAEQRSVTPLLRNSH